MFTEPTCDHASIKFWARVHGAQPAERLPEHVDGVQPVLCFAFLRAREKDERVLLLSWEEFFQRFDLLGLSFIGDMDTTAVPVGYDILYATENPLGLPLSV